MACLLRTSTALQSTGEDFRVLDLVFLGSKVATTSCRADKERSACSSPAVVPECGHLDQARSRPNQHLQDPARSSHMTAAESSNGSSGSHGQQDSQAGQSQAPVQQTQTAQLLQLGAADTRPRRPSADNQQLGLPGQAYPLLQPAQQMGMFGGSSTGNTSGGPPPDAAAASNPDGCTAPTGSSKRPAVELHGSSPGPLALKRQHVGTGTVLSDQLQGTAAPAPVIEEPTAQELLNATHLIVQLLQQQQQQQAALLVQQQGQHHTAAAMAQQPLPLQAQMPAFMQQPQQPPQVYPAAALPGQELLQSGVGAGGAAEPAAVLWPEQNQAPFVPPQPPQLPPAAAVVGPQMQYLYCAPDGQRMLLSAAQVQHCLAVYGPAMASYLTPLPPPPNLLGGPPAAAPSTAAAVFAQNCPTGTYPAVGQEVGAAGGAVWPPTSLAPPAGAAGEATAVAPLSAGAAAGEPVEGGDVAAQPAAGPTRMPPGCVPVTFRHVDAWYDMHARRVLYEGRSMSCNAWCEVVAGKKGGQNWKKAIRVKGNNELLAKLLSDLDSSCS